MNKKLYIQTHGCQMNEYDSSRMGDLLAASHQLELTSNPEEADVLLLNTCSIREKAEEKVFHQLGRWKRLKQQRPELIIGVGGCVASQEGAALRKRAPHVDLVFGPQTLHRLPEMIDRQRRALLPVVDVSFPEIEKFDLLPDPGANGPTASVSIMEGCSKYCSFCVVPYTRGEEISRPFDDVVAEVFHLAQQGVREVTLLGQNVNAYRGRTHQGELADLAELLHYVAAIDGIERIRFTTSHPLEMSDSLIAAYATLPKLAPHLHLPVQSGSDRILARMKRNYTAADYLAIIDRLKAACPTIQLSSDFIVGFPGEEEADFEATLDLIRQVGFDQSFSFIYSPRPGTPAAELPDSVPLEVKGERLARLQALINQQAQAISAAMLGSQQSILVSGPAKRGEGELCGRTGNNRVVNFPASDVGLIGRMANVEIVEVLPNSLRGQLL
ncbi:MAG: tRNA (N6-isopentenyl adenosine(37)-C2)-methylthiotransferase MiaB [Pseudomonadales bacterium]|jgi:tRNA-2-methylthio-N6-dimethylallyladenosine synthase|nr:tRNA (N6-isopentenyl adenosine(37)-C2)-methylthiotransferase MiaB [Pseudomonadales bacterium]MCP5333019.1 tRNA (N6-isopentenyl adenosine(37)-C2)-methylthiotransferase MiaB [Pseudomonadales bacterium]HNC77451.1 tRNA (N6-isopentenyl adenosine(37)-C2)-methylthiotransferase MiaB [Pseudomonadales bacterium]HNF09483.1 tRNA (N6-isopentenyl adenosine(37)-C2)-methylthiotransferase MiaB [Pseudomonadales bacterium]HNN66096.1 tRNA (N6-isopentenyl adenosine(37)-C2)-methylthiotransferase MiaB [Pseudomonad